MPNPPTPDQIKEARLTAGLSRLQLAGLMLDASPEEIERARQLVSMDYAIRQWESGVRTPSAKHVALLLDRLAPQLRDE